MNLTTIVNNGHPIHVASEGPLKLRKGPDGTHKIAKVMFLPTPTEVSRMPDGAPVYEFGDGTTIIDRKGSRQVLPPPDNYNDKASEHSQKVYAGAVPRQGDSNGTPMRTSEGGVRYSAHKTHGHNARLGLLAVSGLLAACNTVLVSPSVGTPNPAAPPQAPASAYQGNNQGGAEGNTSYTPPTAPVPNSPPRIVRINAQSVFLVGQLGQLELVIDEPDGDEVTISWNQKTNIDKYVETKYLSSTRLNLQPQGTTVLFVPEWPGIYGIEATVADKDGESTRTIDVLVKFETPPFEIMGVAINLPGAPRNNDFRLGRELIDRAESIGANYIQFSFVHFMETANSNEIQPCYALPAGEQWCTTPPMEWLRDHILYAKSKGMGVELKPGLVIERGKKGTWQIAPTNSAAWFRSYTNEFILPYAQLAAETGADILAVGNEVTTMQRSTADWQRMIENIRQIYGGMLVYNDSTMRHNNRRGTATLWPFVDMIGSHPYYNGSNGDNNPSVEQMANFIGRQMDDVLMDTVRRYNRPFIADEVGKPDFDGTNYDFTTESGRVADTQEQADWIEAVLQELYKRGAKGVFAWNYNLRRTPGFPGTGTRDIRERPAEELFRAWFSPAYK